MTDTNAVVAILDELADDEKLTAEQVLDLATDPDHPLHRYFEWDDGVAAHQWRLEQARQLIRRWEVLDDDRQIRYRRYTHVASRGNYQRTEFAVSAWRDEILATAKRDMAAYSQKYKVLGSEELRRIANEAFGD